MPLPIRFLLAAALATTAAAASADTRTPLNADPGRAARVSAEIAARQPLSQRADPKAGNAVNISAAALPRVNPYGAYPPSCLADPLPDETSGPSYSATVSLATVDFRTNPVSNGREDVTITLWRIACSSDESVNSAVLMRIQRQGSNEGRQDVYPLFPGIQVSQGGIVFTEDNSSYLLNLARVAIEPNTVITDVYVDTPVTATTTFVLENYASSATTVFDFDAAFSIRFDNFYSSNNRFFINVPAYNPSVSTYPDAFNNLPISGYLATSWYNPETSGEGIVMQVYELRGETDTFVVNFTWSAYDPSGLPFWLTGQVTVPRGTRTVTSPMAYVTGGGLGGNAGAADPPTPWGTATFGFSDCNHLTLTYASNPGLPAGIPQGSGTRSWLRLGRANGMSCE